jgi:hypothetical protein
MPRLPHGIAIVSSPIGKGLTWSRYPCRYVEQLGWVEPASHGGEHPASKEVKVIAAVRRKAGLIIRA